MKAEYENMHGFKNCGQNKIDSEILANSIVFLLEFVPKRLFSFFGGGRGSSNRTQISAIIKTLTFQAIIANIDKVTIKAAMACLYLSIFVSMQITGKM